MCFIKMVLGINFCYKKLSLTVFYVNKFKKRFWKPKNVKCLNCMLSAISSFGLDLCNIFSTVFKTFYVILSLSDTNFNMFLIIKKPYYTSMETTKRTQSTTYWTNLHKFYINSVVHGLIIWILLCKPGLRSSFQFQWFGYLIIRYLVSPIKQKFPFFSYLFNIIGFWSSLVFFYENLNIL